MTIGYSENSVEQKEGTVIFGWYSTTDDKKSCKESTTDYYTIASSSLLDYMGENMPAPSFSEVSIYY